MGRFATFVIGGVVGAVAGMLLTPRTGKETRTYLNNVTGGRVQVPEDVKEKASQAVDVVASTSTKVINTVVDNGSDAYKTVSARVQQATPAAETFANNGDEIREKIDAARDRIAEQVAKNAEAARDATVDKIPGAVDAAMAASKTAKGAAANASETVKGAAANAGGAVKGAAASAGETVKGAAASAGSAVKSAAASAKDTAATAVSNVTSKVVPSGEVIVEEVSVEVTEEAPAAEAEAETQSAAEAEAEDKPAE